MNSPSDISKDPSLKETFAVHFESSFRSQDKTGGPISPPSGITFLPDGGCIISDDFNHRIQVYDAERNVLRTIGGKGKNPGEFHYPKGTAVDGEGNIYVADSWNHRVQKFDPSGNHLMTLGSCGEEPGQLNEPYAIHIEPSGEIVVVERYNHRIQRFNPDGTSLGFIGTRGTVLEEQLAYLFGTSELLFSPPAFEFPTSITCDSHGNYFISDSGNHRIVKFDLEWNKILTFGKRGNEPGQFQYPLCVAPGSNDLLYVADLNNHRIQVFTSSGQYLFSFDQGDASHPIKTPNLTAVDPQGRLHIGFTFNTEILTFQIPAEKQEALVDRLVQSDSKNPEYLFHQGQLHEQNRNSDKALESYRLAVQTLWLEKEDRISCQETGHNLLLRLGKLISESKNQEEAESSLMKGLEVFNGFLQIARRELVEILKDWEEKASEHNQLLIPHQRSLLKQKDDPRVFNQELFQAEKADKTLFRKFRLAAYFYRRTVDKCSQFLAFVLGSDLSGASMGNCLTILEQRFMDLCDLMNHHLDQKEKNEEAMVVSLGQEQNEQKTWEGFLIRFLTNQRMMNLLNNLEFENRAIIRSFQNALLKHPDHPALGRKIRDLFVHSPASPSIAKLQLGFQENIGTHTSIENLLKSLMDQWFRFHGKTQEPEAAGKEAMDFSPVPYNSENLDLDGFIRALRVEGMPLEKSEASLVCGNERYVAEHLKEDGDSLTQKLLEILNIQKTYQEKAEELFGQLCELIGQKEGLEQKIKEVNPQDKKAPINLENSKTLIDFQISLVRRMILTLDFNETNNFNRLIIGSALLGLNEAHGKTSETKALFNTLNAYRSQLQESLQQGLRERKSNYFELSGLNAKLKEIDFIGNVENMNHSMQISENIHQLQNKLEHLELRLNRWSKNKNLLDKLFVYLANAGIYDDAGPTSVLISRFQNSFGILNPSMGTPLRPFGICLTRSGEWAVVGHDNHRVFLFSEGGLYSARFGGWGNSPGKFKFPGSIAADPEGNLYVTDERNQRVQKFSPDGKFILSLGQGPENKLGDIFSVSTDKDGKVWVADPENDRIQVYNSDGTLDRSLINPGNKPENIFKPLSVFCFENGEYLVGDRSEYLLKRFGPDGTLLHQFGKGENFSDEFYFLTAHPQHGIFASDFWNNRIVHLNHRLEVVSIYQPSGKRAGELGRVGGLAISGDSLAVSDYDNFRVQVFKLP